MAAKHYVFFTLIVNGLFPWGIYTVLSGHMHSITALTIATLAPLTDNLVHFWKHKKLDALGGLLLFTFALTLGLAALGGDERLLLIRESLITGSVGLIFLGSLAFRKPLMFYLARKFLNPKMLGANAKYAYFQFVMRLMTAVWGLFLLGEAAVRVVLVYRLTTAQFLAVSNFVLYGFIGAAILWTVWYRRKSARRLESIKLREVQSPWTS